MLANSIEVLGTYRVLANIYYSKGYYYLLIAFIHLTQS